MYFKPAVATSLGQALYPCAISDEVCPIHAAVENGRCILFFSREINSTKKKSFTKKTDFIYIAMKPISRFFSYLYSFRSP